MLGSARVGGNSEILARQAASVLPERVSSTWLALRELPLPAFADLRHVGDGGYPPPVGHEKVLFDATMTATDLVVVTPLYWYTVSTAVKLYLDYWSGWLRVPGVDFRGAMAAKTLWAVTTFAGDRAKTKPAMETLRLCADFFGMRWGGALLGNGSRPGDVHADSDAMTAARTFLLPSR